MDEILSLIESDYQSAKPKHIFKPIYNFCGKKIYLTNTWQIGYQMKMDNRGLKLRLEFSGLDPSLMKILQKI